MGYSQDSKFTVTRNLLKKIKAIEDLDKPIKIYIDAIDLFTEGAPDSNIGMITIIDSMGLPSLKFVPNVQLTRSVKLKMEDGVPPKEPKIFGKTLKKKDAIPITPSQGLAGIPTPVEPVK